MIGIQWRSWDDNGHRAIPKCYIYVRHDCGLWKVRSTCAVLTARLYDVSKTEPRKCCMRTVNVEALKINRDC